MIKYQSEEYREIIKAYDSKYKSEIDQTDDFWWLHLLSVSNHINLLLSKVYDKYEKQNRKKPDQQVITLHTLIYFIENDLQFYNKSEKDKLQQTIN